MLSESGPSGEVFTFSWLTEPLLGHDLREAGPAWFPVVHAWVINLVPLACHCGILKFWWSYPSLLTRRLVRPYPVKV
jgi:hypothetical protein